jgi:hypothetical protein
MLNRLLIGVMIDEVQCLSQFKKATEINGKIKKNVNHQFETKQRQDSNP